jgi:hypothetical protein
MVATVRTSEPLATTPQGSQHERSDPVTITSPPRSFGTTQLLRLYIHLAITALIAFGGFALVFILARLNRAVDIGALVFIAGSIGAVVNNYYRLSKISAGLAVTPSHTPSSVVIIIQFYVSFLISGALGVVMYVLCVSNLLDGALFPDFENAANAYMGISGLLQEVRPTRNLDAAKVILWAFLAGFSERFIPNILDRFVTQAQQERTTAPVQQRGI